MNKTASFVCLVLGAVLFSSKQASATVSMYQAAVQADATALHLWSFQGASVEDTVGSNDLVATVYGTGSSTGAITYGAGFDAADSAFTPHRGANGGAAFVTTTAVTMPTTVTYEAIIRPSSLLSGTGYMFGSTTGTNRTYFVSQHGGVAPDQDIKSIFGTDFLNQNTTVDNFTGGDWYYVAVTASYSGGLVTVNAWSANLTTGSALTQTTTNQTETATGLNATKYGLGMLHLSSTNANQEAFVGAIDEVALYSGIKDQAFFQSQLALIMVPEPSFSLLCVMGCGALVLRRRR